MRNSRFIWRQLYVCYQWVISDSSVFHKYYMRLFMYSVRNTYTNIYFFSDFQWNLGVTSAKHASYVCWSLVESRRQHYSGNVFADNHWYSTHIPRIVRVRTTQTTQEIRKTGQTFTRSRVLSCSKPGIAQSTDTAKGAHAWWQGGKSNDAPQISLIFTDILGLCFYKLASVCMMDIEGHPWRYFMKLCDFKVLMNILVTCL